MMVSQTKSKRGFEVTTRDIINAYEEHRTLNPNQVWFRKEEIKKELEKPLISHEQHKAYVVTLGFKKVRSRCPICYTEDLIRRNLIDRFFGKEVKK